MPTYNDAKRAPVCPRVNWISASAASFSSPATRLPLTSTASSPESESERCDRIRRGLARRTGRCRPRSTRHRAPLRTSAIARCSLPASLISAITPRTATRRRRRQVDQRVDRGAHRRRVGVVGVVEDDRARRRPFDLHAHRRQTHARQRCRAGRDVAADRADARQRRRGVRRHVPTADRQPHVGAAPRRVDGERRPASSSSVDIADAHVCSRRPRRTAGIVAAVSAAHRPNSIDRRR